MRNSTRYWPKFIDEIEVAKIETNTQEVRKIIGKAGLDSDENMNSLDFKNVNSNVPLKKSIDVALRIHYEQKKCT